uniref:NADH dehydrogenase [ubiquinone] 1 beta subcomplex subunit 9 n=1 Tax=Aotus nancymaae TaxID=37293 RepID=A0A2K5EUU4_AOTNA
MAFSAPAAYLTHQQKVLWFYKRALSHLESWSRFEEHKNEKDMTKAIQLLREAEEDFWYRQHPQPYIFSDSPGGTSYERYECYKVSENCLDTWHPSQKAMYPDYFLEEEPPPGGPLTKALPPARKEGDLPPLWWHINLFNYPM